MPHPTAPPTSLEIETLSPKTILIVGAGPVGLALATTLSRFGVKSVLLERYEAATQWPKMDLTTARSVEIFRSLGLADGLRQRGVPSHYPFTCLFSAGMHEKEAVTKWDLSSVDGMRQEIESKNDGSLPAEPWQRISQAVFETWLREECHKNPLVDFRSGCEVTGATECENGVQVTFLERSSGEQKVISSAYAAACDGAHSLLRSSIGIQLQGGPLPVKVLLVHFKSKDLAALHRQGQFWHIFFPQAGGSMKGAIIAQDEIDTWTVQRFVLPNENENDISSEEAVYQVLGGMGEPYPIRIDEVLVRSCWSPGIAIADHYVSPQGRVLLAGDSAHQTTPGGGYGMNTGIADAFDLGWKLAAQVQRWGGEALLPAYETERRAIGQLSLHWSKVHMMNVSAMSRTVGLDKDVIRAETPEGDAMRKAMHEYAQTHDAHNKCVGVEMGYRYQSSLCVPSALDESTSPPEFDARKYIPSTYPGSRVPHVFLKDGKSILEKLEPASFNLVLFSERLTDGANSFNAKAKEKGIPLNVVKLSGETHARDIWGADCVLVRPDHFVSWHANSPITPDEADGILSKATGWGQ